MFDRVWHNGNACDYMITLQTIHGATNVFFYDMTSYVDFISTCRRSSIRFTLAKYSTRHESYTELRLSDIGM